MNFFEQHFTAETLQEGQVILIDKPLGWTSFQVVNKIRWHFKKSLGLNKLKIGHAGTLDPLATGLLLLCTGKKTKSIAELQEGEKEYTGTFTLGGTTPSYDLETTVDHTFPFEHLSPNQLYNATAQFTGEIMQQPPLFSALKKEGKRLYEFARIGTSIEVPSRKVKVSTFELTQIALPNVTFLVRCGKGTYIRSLAHDFGKAVQSGAHLSSLRRTQSGEFRVEKAYTLESVLN
ncbi:MAG: tRNA pseudouridine(55) synthase TruB [Flavobacteriaceae bacterium]|nr:tRNA pseudouridine(55) synthase TruB [Flavobacteriia bacterium]